MRKHNDFSGVGTRGRREYILIRNRDEVAGVVGLVGGKSGRSGRS